MDKWNKILQTSIMGMIIVRFLDRNMKVEIEDRVDGIWIYGWKEEIKPAVYNYWVRLQPDNKGSDYIVDFTINLKPMLEPVLKFVKQWED